MRRLKRDPLERAFLRGYQYGVGGKSRELCP
ncbi:MAG: ribosome modulation factor, partial [Pseudomonas sp.]